MPPEEEDANEPAVGRGINADLEMMRQRALESERRGEAVVMRDPLIRKRPPKRPSSSW